MVEEIPPLDGRISPVRWKDLLPYCGRISRPIVEENRGSWKVLPASCGRISPLMVEGFPLCRARCAPETQKSPSFALCLYVFVTFFVSLLSQTDPATLMVEGFTPSRRP
jgi:hypothetical protein